MTFYENRVKQLNKILSHHNLVFYVDNKTILCNGIKVYDVHPRFSELVINGKLQQHYYDNIENLFSFDELTRIETKKMVRRLSRQIAAKKATIWNKGKTKDTDYRLLKLSKEREGDGNPVHKISNKQEWKTKISVGMKIAIRDGKVTPKSTNRLCNERYVYNKKSYRSSWEILFIHLNPDCEYETIRIPYTFNNKNHITIVDFVNHETKTLIEIKPNNIAKRKKEQAKIQSIKEYAISIGYNFVLVSEIEITNILKTHPTHTLPLDSFIVEKLKRYENKKN